MPATHPLPTRKQKHRRVPFSARVVRCDGSAEWSSVNMSAGGMFVTGSPLLTPGTEIEVGVWLPDDRADREIVARARVVWINDPAADFGRRPDVPAGMGMELFDLDDEDRAALRALLYGDSEETVEAAGPADVGIEVGPYRILGLLGRGGMGEVYLAEHTSFGRRVALKRLHHRLARDPAATRRFFDEGRLVNRLQHQNILQIVDFITEGARHYYVMELLEGENLGELLDAGEPLPVERAVRIGIQLCDAVQAVHSAGIVHRDIKPTNVLLVEHRGSPDFVKLLDFGIAKLRGPDPERRPGVAVGTPAFMAPEQCLGDPPDVRADIYALGAVLFHMVTGRLVFEADTWSQMLVKQVNERPPRPTQVGAGGVPPRLERLIMRCLRKSAWLRPPSARAVGDELCLTLAEIETPPPRRAPGFARRVAPLAAVAAAVTAAAAVAFTAAGELAPSPRPAVDPTVVLQPTPRAPGPEPPPEPAARRLSSAQVTARLRLAADHVRQGEPLAAVELCRAILRARPYSARTYRALGVAYSRMRADSLACAAYRRYLRLAPHAEDRSEVLTVLESCP